MKADTIQAPIASIETNNGQVPFIPANPRIWSLKELEKLKRSIQRTPQLLAARPPIAVENDGKYVVIAGNLRLCAAKDLGLDSLEIFVLPKDLPASRVKEIAVIDNAQFGDWDYDALANEFSEYDLTEYNIHDYEIPDDGPSDTPAPPVDDREVIEIVLTPDEFNFVTSKLREIDTTLEAAVLKLFNYGS